MDDYDFGELLVLQHSDAVGLGGIRTMLDERAGRRPWKLVHVGNGDAVPDLTDRTRGILVLGGLMSVLDDDLDWLEAELALLRDARAKEVPVLGICLGAQLLGLAHGGEVTRRDAIDLGLFRLRSVDGDDPVAAGWPDDGVVWSSHNDEVTSLPPDATPLLAGNGTSAPSGTPAWRLDGHVYALQFHPEADPAIVRSWVEHGSLGEDAAAAGADLEGLLAELEASARFVRSTGLAAVGRWLDGVVGAGDPSPRKHRKAA